MTATRLIVSAGLVVVMGASRPGAQTAPPNALGVSIGHMHLVVRNIEASKKLWMAMGAMPAKLGPNEVMKFPGMLVLLRQGEPAGGSVGSVVNDIGFKVANIQESLAKWRTAGLETEPGLRPTQAFIITPERLRIEILEDTALKVPIAADHVHFFAPEANVAEMKAWYARMFGGTPAQQGANDVVGMPGGVMLSFTKAPDGARGAPTPGRALDHIGFEVTGLEAFCKKLEAAGIKFDRTFQRSATGLLVANITDPWGTYIELSEGMNKL
jgi:catechol 2,3-dioxygenase-like lactoylglutathione lyase family enzyme